MRFVLPIRTSKRKKEAKSPQQQRDLASSWALAHDHDIVAVLDSGRDESGKTMDRETIHRAMEMVRAGEADGIVFALTDRLGRAPIEESMAWIRQLNLVGHLALADAGGEPVNLSDPNAETALVMQLQFARQYWLAAARRFRQSQRDAIKAGKWIGAAPLGFVRVKGRLVEDETTGPIVREAYRRAARDGLHAAVDYLTEAVPARKWNTDHVRRLLAGRVYLGENRYVLAEDPGNFAAETLVSPLRHDALTTLDDWTAAQTEPQQRRSNGDYPLSNLVLCGECDAGLTGQLQSVHAKQYRRMRCSQCHRCSIGADGLEAHVRAELSALLADDAFRVRFSVDGLDAARTALEQAGDEKDRHSRDLRGRRLMGEQTFYAVLEAYALELEQAQLAYQQVATRAARSSDVPAADGLDDDAGLSRAVSWAIAVAGLRIVVRRGRGTLAERVTFDVLDDGAGMLAA